MTLWFVLEEKRPKKKNPLYEKHAYTLLLENTKVAAVFLSALNIPGYVRDNQDVRSFITVPQEFRGPASKFIEHALL